MPRKIDIYDIPSDTEHLSYATSSGRWIYRITNPDDLINENNIVRTYDRALQNDDFVVFQEPITKPKNISIGNDKQNLTILYLHKILQLMLVLLLMK